MLKELQEQFAQALTVAENLRKKYDGKSANMTPDELQTWEKAMADADNLQKQIELAKKEDGLRQWSDQLEKGLAQVAEGGKVSEKDNRPVSLEEKAFSKFLLSGEKSLSSDEQKALSVGSDPDGGFFTMPMVLASRFIDLVRDQVFIRKWASVFPLNGAAQGLGANALDTDAEDFDWTSELGTGNEEDTIKIGRRVLKPNPVAKRLKISRTLLRLEQNGGIQFVLSRLAYKHGVTEEKAFLLGTGSNQPLGICVASAQGISTSRDKSTAAANVIAADDFWRTHGALKGEYRARARWLIHRNLETRIRILKDANNNYIWQPGGGFNGQMLVAGMPNTICGLPYDITEFMTDPSDTGNITTGTYVAALGDYSYYWIADQMSAMEVQRLEELYAESNQVGFIMRKETDAMPVREEAFARLKVS